MRIISLNVNGIRSAAKKDFFSWIEEIDADVLCLQEIRAQEDKRSEEIYYPKGYHCYYKDAERKGYSGVAIYSKHEPENVIDELGWDLADEEGRYLQIDFKDLSIASIYLPSGSSKEERQDIKYAMMDWYMPILRKMRKDERQYILCGDWNIAHKKIDIKNWRGNQKNSGFLPEERAWLDELFDKTGYVDAFRVLNQEPDQYTWWSNRGRAWDNNVGWRIDYQVISPELKDKVKAVDIYKEQRFSDHSPLIIDYDLKF